MLEVKYTEDLIEAGCDEAGRGCLAGPVFAAAVILPKDFKNELIDDSKKLTGLQRTKLRRVIEEQALSWAVSSVSNDEIDELNILNASFLAMHHSIEKLTLLPQLLLIDGNRFNVYKNIAHTCIVKGDGKYASIAAASILAKTYRDDYMIQLHKKYPVFGWNKNKGYPTSAHRFAIASHGYTEYHRKSFKLHSQLKIKFV